MGVDTIAHHRYANKVASFGHVAVGCFAGRALYPQTRARAAVIGVMLAWSALSMLPDADVIAFVFRIPYAAPFGHRGAAHSLVIAAGIGIIVWAAACARASQRRALVVGLTAMAVVASHDLLDTLTDGGLGVALFWPFDTTRYFAPWRPIPVAPIGAGMLSARGLYCVLVEIVMFAPFWVAAVVMSWRAGRHSGHLT